MVMRPDAGTGGAVGRLWLTWVALLLAAVMPAAQAADDMWAEAVVTETAPFQEQAVIYTVRIYSPQNLTTADVELPRAGGVSLEQLGGSQARLSQVGQRQYVVNEFRYLLTPLQSGAIRVPPARVRVTWTEQSSWNSAYQGRSWGYGGAAQPRNADLSTREVALSVRPPATSTRPWLPLYHLRTDAQWQRPEEMHVGEPVTLTITLTAWGAKGEQLPHVGPLLQRGQGYRVYPERPETGWDMSRDGSTVVGWRRETFTIVPQVEGELDLPDVDVPWWEISRSREIPTRIPLGGLWARAAQGEPDGPVGAVGIQSPFSSHAMLYFWVPVLSALLLAFALGWRVAQIQRCEPPRVDADAPVNRGWPHLGGWRWPERQVWIQALPVPAHRALQWVNRGIALAANLGERGRRAAARLLPRRVRVDRHLELIEAAQDPAALAQAIQRVATEHLRVKPNNPLPQLAQLVAAQRPPAERITLRALLRELEVALYSERSLDVAAWKRSFLPPFRRVLLDRLRVVERRRVYTGLPALNP